MYKNRFYRAVNFLIKTVSWGLVLATLLVCGLFIRFSVAPIDLEWVKTSVIEQTALVLPDWRLSFFDASLSFDFGDMRPSLLINGARLDQDAKNIHAEIGALRVGLSRASLYGDIGLTNVTIERLDIRAFDDFWREDTSLDKPALETGAGSEAEGAEGAEDAEGAMPFFPPEGGAPNGQAFKPLVAGLFKLVKDLHTVLPALSYISIRESHLEGAYRALGLGLDVARLRAEFNEDRFRLDLQAKLQQKGLARDEASLGFSLYGEGSDDEIVLNLQLDEWRPSDIQAFIPGLEGFKAVHIPVSARLEAAFSKRKGLETIDVNLDLGRGDIQDLALYPKAAPIAYGTIEAHYALEKGAIDIKRFDLALEPGLVEARGQIYWLKGEKSPGLRLQATLDQAHVSDILTYWPIARHPNGLERGGRAWIFQHMLDGEVYDIGFDFDRNPDGSGGLKGNELFEARFSYRDLDSYALQSLPPLYEISGRGRATADSIDMEISHGRIAKMDIGPSRFKLDHLREQGEQMGVFDLSLEGRVPELLKLIDYYPLNIVEKTHIPAPRLDGQAKLRAEFSLPLSSERSREIQYQVTGDIKEAKVLDLLDGEGLSRGDLRLKLDNDKLLIDGTGRVNGVPLSLSWYEDFAIARADPKAATSFLKIEGLADQNQLRALKVPVERYLDGASHLSADFKGRSLAFREGSFKIDLSHTRLMVKELGWAKEKSVPAEASGKIYLAAPDERHAFSRIAPLHITGTGLKADLDIRWRADGEGLIIDADVPAMGLNQFTAHIIQSREILKDNPLGRVNYEIDFKGPRLDLRPFLGVGSAEEGGPAPEAQKNLRINKQADPDASIEPRLVITIDVDSLELLNDERLNNVSGTLVFEDGVPVAVNMQGAPGISGESGAGAPLSLMITDDLTQTLSLEPAKHLRRLTLSTGYTGALFRGLGYFSHLKRGDMQLVGSTSGWGKTLTVQADITAKATTLVTTKALNSTVNSGVVSGVDRLLGSEPMLLNQLDLRLGYADGLLDISRMKANGDRLGLTMEGQLDTKNGKINLNGVLIPAYGLNSLLGRLPLIGGLFSGGEGKGLIGFTYRIKGALSDPDVSVSALSGLAPGFLRAIFEGRKGKVKDVKLPAEKGEKGTGKNKKGAVKKALPGQETAGESDGDEEDSPNPNHKAPDGSR